MNIMRKTPSGSLGKTYEWTLGGMAAASMEIKDNATTGRASTVSFYAFDHKGEEHRVSFTRDEVMSMVAAIEWAETPQERKRG